MENLKNVAVDDSRLKKLLEKGVPESMRIPKNPMIPTVFDIRQDDYDEPIVELPPPYIGVTGFMTVEEVEAVLSVFPEHSRRKLMVGALASYGIICGEGNSRPNRYPEAQNIRDIFPDDARALNLIHYKTDFPEALAEQLITVRDHFGGPSLHGFQLNMPWPDLGALYRYRRESKNKDIAVLQVGRRSMRAVGHSPERLAREVLGYKGVVDYVLLDPSGGRGKQLDTEEMLRYIRTLSACELGMGLAVAGGLGPDTLHLVAPLSEEFPDLSIDAEGQLRDNDDRLDIERAQAYVAQALEMFA